ncbi:hypothetical protein GX51_06279 [Blastomyces parvus]|uniref:Uncharacterized protein n=1 Tax=Blastomyces parvus TaxID=2060905 RepID=A0A2B7WSH8_9EURO|nr:hypothetical protein GX51_06279 [Blastomyces parvus]
MNQRVVLDFGNQTTETYSKDYLLGWIRAELGNGKSPDDIWVTSLTSRHRPLDNRLTQDVWTRNLIRGPWKDVFLPLWTEAI